MIKSYMHIIPCDWHFISFVSILCPNILEAWDWKSTFDFRYKPLSLSLSLYLHVYIYISISISTRQCLRITHFSLMFDKTNATPRMCIDHTTILEHTGWKDTNVWICYYQLTPSLVVIKHCVNNNFYSHYFTNQMPY